MLERRRPPLAILWGQAKFVSDARYRSFLLQSPISIHDKATTLDLIDDAPTRDVFVLMIGNCLRNGLSCRRGRVSPLPSTPHLVVPPRMRQEVAIGLCFGKRGCIDQQSPRFLDAGMPQKMPTEPVITIFLVHAVPEESCPVHSAAPAFA